MIAQPVEWVLVIFYGPSAHRATYGRLDRQDTKYTKDYIQLSKREQFLDEVNRLFPAVHSGDASVSITYQWPSGTAPGALFFNSADRPHLKWETNLGAPKPWKMSLSPSDATAETIPGDPSHLDFAAAENELALLSSRGAGQPFLLAIKLRDEARKLHLRAYLKEPSPTYSWADLNLVPQDIRDLAAKTSRKSALAWASFVSGGTMPGAKTGVAISELGATASPASVIDALDADTGRAVAEYLRSPGYGLFFDPTRNHDAWYQPVPLSEQIAASVDTYVEMLDDRYPATQQGDSAAESLEVDGSEVEFFRGQIKDENYEVADSTATVKTRGSAQRAFAEVVKANYGYKCAITGVATKDFLVASHIVPWSEDHSVRLDPSNGICLSLIVDRAFEKGYLLIEDDFTIRVDWGKVANDRVLGELLGPYDEQKLKPPSLGAPRPEFLQRRRALVISRPAETSE